MPTRRCSPQGGQRQTVGLHVSLGLLNTRRASAAKPLPRSHLTRALPRAGVHTLSLAVVSAASGRSFVSARVTFQLARDLQPSAFGDPDLRVLHPSGGQLLPPASALRARLRVANVPRAGARLVLLVDGEVHPTNTVAATTTTRPQLRQRPCAAPHARGGRRAMTGAPPRARQEAGALDLEPHDRRGAGGSDPEEGVVQLPALPAGQHLLQAALVPRAGAGADALAGGGVVEAVVPFELQGEAEPALAAAAAAAAAVGVSGGEGREGGGGGTEGTGGGEGGGVEGAAAADKEDREGGAPGTLSAVSIGVLVSAGPRTLARTLRALARAGLPHAPGELLVFVQARPAPPLEPLQPHSQRSAQRRRRAAAPPHRGGRTVG